MTPRILVVDDDAHIRDVLCFALEKAGMTTVAVRDGAEALRRFADGEHDLVVLDVGMPELDGLDVCRRLRKISDVPILFLSARDEEIDRVLGLELGADDYVTKPFSPRELVARVKVILRRAQGATPSKAISTLERGGLVLDADAHTAAFEGRAVMLTSIEFAILRCLLARPKSVLSRDQILDAAYGPNIHVADRTIDSHIRNIRAKFVGVGCDSVVETVHGVGFRIGGCAAIP